MASFPGGGQDSALPWEWSSLCGYLSSWGIPTLINSQGQRALAHWAFGTEHVRIQSGPLSFPNRCPPNREPGNPKEDCGSSAAAATFPLPLSTLTSILSLVNSQDPHYPSSQLHQPCRSLFGHAHSGQNAPSFGSGPSATASVGCWQRYIHIPAAAASAQGCFPRTHS